MSDEELQLREEEGTPVTRKHRRNYSAEYKLESIDWAHKYSINSAAKKFTKGIRSRIQDWLKNEDEIRRQVSIFIYYNFNCKLLTLGNHMPLERSAMAADVTTTTKVGNSDDEAEVDLGM
uniref:Transposase n=1 Tax=Ditylenchus dipsaci TaxID=166011 RepID=A0A915ERM2_9BILA